MGLFSKFKKDTPAKNKRSAVLTVLKNERITPEGSRIHFAVPSELKNDFQFVPGQYLNIHVDVNGKKEVRSYSICSGPNEDLAIAVKTVENGIVSNYLVNELQAGAQLEVDFPMGNFKLDPTHSFVVCFAAGSGVTPFMSFAKSLGSMQQMRLYFGNAKKESTFFFNELTAMSNPKTTFTFTKEQNEGHLEGRLDKHNVSELIKADLMILRADAFYICGPEDMILSVQEVLQIFGIPKEKIHFELFTTPVLMKSEETSATSGNFSGVSQVSAILDGEISRVELSTEGKTLLEALDQAGMDVPYSCRGGVCCTCRAKVIEGSAKMTINYSLTDQEVADGYILTCQAHPTSEILKIDFDA